jgi:hypothetical protein
LAIEPFTALAEADARSVIEEAERLLSFVARGAQSLDVRMLPLAA